MKSENIKNNEFYYLSDFFKMDSIYNTKKDMKNLLEILSNE